MLVAAEEGTSSDDVEWRRRKPQLVCAVSGSPIHSQAYCAGARSGAEVGEGLVLLGERRGGGLLEFRLLR
jgi:hypothetical protein